MNRPPQKLPMGQPLEEKPAAPAPARKPAGPQGPGPNQPGPYRSPTPVRRKGSGSKVAVIILSVVGGIALVIALSCGGAVWFVYSKARQAAAAVEAEVERARQQANNRNGNPPWQPQVGPSHPAAKPIDSVARANEALSDSNLFRRRDALQYLKDQTVDDDQRNAVVAKTLPLLSDRQVHGDAKAVLVKWANTDHTSQLVALADAAYASNERDKQQAAIEVLAATGSEQAPAAIAKYYGTRHDTTTARQAFETIGPSSAPYLLPFLNDADGGLRQTAHDLLTQWEVEEKTLAAQSLNDLKGGDDNRAREAARWFAAHLIVDETLSPQVSTALVSLLPNRTVRNDAFGALKFWASADTVPVLIETANVAHSAEDREAEKAAVVLLTGLNDERALPTYAAYLETRHDRTAAKAAFSAIGESGAKALLPFIHDPDSSVRQISHDLLAEWEIEKSHWLTQSMTDLQSTDENRRRQAIRYLTESEPDESVKSAVALSLIGLVDDQRLRFDALRALQTWATADTVPKLIELLDHEDRGVQSNARTILIATKDPRAVPPIASGFGDDFLKRIEARKALVAMGPVAETAFWPHVTHKDWRVAKDACDALGEIGTAKSIPILQAAMTQDTAFVKGAAESAIKRIEEAKREAGPMPAIAVADPGDDGTRKMRTWTDATGANTIEALYIEFALGKVRLRTLDGKFLSLKLNQLSAEDRQYVMQQVQQK